MRGGRIREQNLLESANFTKKDGLSSTQKIQKPQIDRQHAHVHVKENFCLAMLFPPINMNKTLDSIADFIKTNFNIISTFLLRVNIPLFPMH